MTEKKKGRKPGVYAIYKGDEYLMSGTITEIATARGVTKKYLWWLLTPAYKRRCEKWANKNRLTLTRL